MYRSARQAKPLQLPLQLMMHDAAWRSVSGFTRALSEKASQAQWTELLRDLVMQGVEVPGECRCTDPRDISSWRHKNHGAYNQAIRGVIISARARANMLHASYSETAAGIYTPGLSREKLQDFLSREPQLAWFK